MVRFGGNASLKSNMDFTFFHLGNSNYTIETEVETHKNVLIYT